MNEADLPTPAPAVDVLAVGAHPDDVEWGCGGLLAALAEDGLRVGILVLTRGEAGTRGDAELRHAEAEEGARRLGAHHLAFLDCGDGRLRNGPEEEERVMYHLRLLRPRLLLAPPLADRHPDHERAGALVRAAAFYSGLRKRPALDAAGAEIEGSVLPPHRPSMILHYMLHEPFDPDVIVDCTASWQRKVEALSAHASQFPAANGDDGDESPPADTTWVSKRSFWEAIEGRARHYGQRIGCEFAEPFLTGGPLGVTPTQFRALYLPPAPADD